MKILCIVPPYVASYFNAGHHLPVFQVAAYLREKRQVVVIARDFAALNATWRDVCELLIERFDVIAVLNDYDGVDGFERFVSYTREISPQSRLLTFGRGSRQTPGFFKRYHFDAIVASGDYEAGVTGYVDYLQGGPVPSGVWLRNNDYAPSSPGVFLDAEDWVLPDITDIPYEHYDRLYANDLAKFCGIPARRELVVPIARGCPVGCTFCDVPTQQGLKERRVKVETVVSYLEKCLSLQPFEYVSFYAPTFTLKRNWVLTFCSEVRNRLPLLKWKCVTTLAHLDDDLIAEIGTAGCVRVSAGIETFDAGAAQHLPQVKRNADANLHRIASACSKAGVEINCFVMVGMPHERIDRSAETINTLIDQGFRVRPTIFTPYENMSADMSVQEFSGYNRQLLADGPWTSAERSMAYEMLYANSHDKPTSIAERIPVLRTTK